MLLRCFRRAFFCLGLSLGLTGATLAETGSPSPLPWVSALLAEPDQTPSFAHEVQAAAQLAAHNPLTAWQTLAAWGGWRLEVASPHLVGGADPLVRALQRLSQASASAPMLAPSRRALPEPLRTAWAQQIEALVVARSHLDEALKDVWPAGLVTEQDLRPVLLRQALHGDFQAGDPVDIRQTVGRINRQALAQGMGVLLQAADHLQRTLKQRRWPALVWQHRTPWGLIRLDTTHQARRHLVQDPLLWVSLGGDDHYRFMPRTANNPISVFMDLRGRDDYVSEHDGADPSVGFWGLGLMWDNEGPNRYQGTWLAQGAGLMGAGVLVDGSPVEGQGSHFQATGHAQAFALDGLALLMAGDGHDLLDALTHAQGSAGPLGLAWLINAAGDDRYDLGNARVVQASSQLADRNASMGQGAGRGWRGLGALPDTPGGMGVLVDLAGHDTYTAQVFAQGVGFQQGLGMLVDAGGNNRHEAAWYALGAAAHQAVGVFWGSGQGKAAYKLTHASGLGAATDGSVGWFEDSGGLFDEVAADFSRGQAMRGSFAVCKTRGQNIMKQACRR